MCDSYVYVVQRRYIFGVLLVRFRARVYEFLSEVLQCCLTRNCGVFVLLYVMSNVRTNVKMGTVIVGYGIAVYGRRLVPPVQWALYTAFREG